MGCALQYQTSYERSTILFYVRGYLTFQECVLTTNIRDLSLELLLTLSLSFPVTGREESYPALQWPPSTLCFHILFGL